MTLSSRPSWVKSQQTPQRSLEDSPYHLRTICEWNTTSSPTQSCGTWDSIREAESRPDQGHKSLPVSASNGSPRCRSVDRLVCAGESVDYRSLQHLGQALFQAFIFWQEGGPNSRYLCTFPVRGELACREGSDHWNSEERSSLPGLLIEANKITRGTSFNQRQL